MEAIEGWQAAGPDSIKGWILAWWYFSLEEEPSRGRIQVEVEFYEISWIN